jgi:branched-chain amino acid transport system substrate-binding protein
MVPAWRADAGNQGLHTSTAAAFQALGGSASAGIEYSDTNPDFAAVVSALEAQVLQAQGQVGAGAVGVYLASFDETVQLFHAAANSPILSGVKWYGGDGVVQSQALQDDLPAAQFAATVGFPCPTFGLDASARAIWEPLSTRIQNKTGFAPDAFGLAAYDATRVAAIANLEASIHAGINARRAALTATANRHFGATGWCLLDTAGDRAIGNFDFYALRPAGAGFTWQLVARYTNGQIVRE